MQKISIVSPTYNEVGNINELYERIKCAIKNLEYEFEIIIIDNKSTDGTFEKLKDIAERDKTLKLIRNIKNYGHVRSPYWGILQGTGDAVVYLASDLQDMPEYIPDFIKLWEQGHLVVMATKKDTELGIINKKSRELFYNLIDLVSPHKTVKNTTGFGIYDRKVIDTIRQINDPEPYFRGLVSEIGFPIYEYKTVQLKRKNGISKNHIYTLVDYAILAVINNSTIPIRLITLIGFATVLISMMVGMVFLIKKIVYWDSYTLGISPLLVPIIFLFGLQFLFMGIIGEYLRILLLRAKNRPIVVEMERINFD